MNSWEKRYEQSYNTRIAKGKKTLFDFNKLNKQIEFFKPIEGNNIIDIIPYIIKTDKHPLVRTGGMKIGDMDYVMDIFAHENIGINNMSVICPLKNYGKPCPICEAAQKYRTEGKMTEYATLKPKRLVYYNILDKSEDILKLKVFNTKYFLFEKELIEEAQTGVRMDGKYVDFANPETGKSVRFRGSLAKMGNVEYLEYKGFQFLDRSYKVTKYIAETVSFDELIVIPTYDELFALLNGVEDEDDVLTEPAVVKNDETAQISVTEPVVTSHTEEIKCPYGFKFGVDYDSTEKCDACLVADKTLWKRCMQAYAVEHE